MTEFADLVSTFEIDPEALIRRSAALERARAGAKMRSRGVSRDLVQKAMRGEDLPRRVRAKLTRALRDLAPGATPPWAQRPPRTTPTPAAVIVPTPAAPQGETAEVTSTS